MTIKGAKKVSGPSKSLDFVPGQFRNLEVAPLSDFRGLNSLPQAPYLAEVGYIGNFMPMFYESRPFSRSFLVFGL